MQIENTPKRDLRAVFAEMDRFFRREGRVHDAMRAIAAHLDEQGIAYAIAGGMALVAHGYERVTTNLDVLIGAKDLEEGRRAIVEYHEIESSVPIRLLEAGRYPGDRRPKPVAFPDPADVTVEIGGIKYVGLAPLMEMKLASGISNPGRLKDLADVQETIRILKLPREFGTRLNAYVRGKFEELY